MSRVLAGCDHYSGPTFSAVILLFNKEVTSLLNNKITAERVGLHRGFISISLGLRLK
jgi:hypothetical protein